ncbi:sensor histidine kinase [Crocinitomix catalasitica]|uniref:sensor histidine kinase n=1 Tax=Crocinitomix catalasitica TaxID=184607 RepID=UPI00146F9967|nr:sensor histidine kinase [Crocinitomix catalasitica]
MKQILVFLLLLWIPLKGNSQVDTREKLKIVKGDFSDSVKIEAIGDLLGYYVFRDVDSLQHYLQLYRSYITVDSYAYPNYLHGMSLYKQAIGENESALNYLDSSLAVSLEKGDSVSYVSVANNKVRMLLHKGDLKSASQLLMECMKIYSVALTDSCAKTLKLNYLLSLIRKADIDCQSSMHKKAEQTLEEAYDYAVKLGDSLKILEIELNLAKEMIHVGDTAQAMEYFLRGRDYIKNNKLEFYYGFIEKYLLIIHTENNEEEKARKIYDEVLEKYNSGGTFLHAFEVISIYLGLYDLEVGDLDLAINRCLEGYMATSGTDDLISDHEKACNCLMLAYERKGDYETAYKYASEFLELESNLLAFDAGMAMNLEDEERRWKEEEYRMNIANELVLQQQQFKIEKHELFIQEKNRLAISLVIFSCLLGGLFYVIYRQFKRTTNQKAIISKSLEEKKLLLKEIHHRVKNNFQIIQSLLNLHANQLTDKRLSEPLLEAKNRIRSMAIVHENLYGTNSLDEIEMSIYFNSLVDAVCEGFSQKKIQSKIVTNNLVITIQEAMPLGLIINELITNSMKYGANEMGEVNFEIRIDYIKESTYSLHYHDEGPGLSKDVDFDNLNTLGFELVQILTDQLGGEPKFSNENGFAFDTEFIIIKS